MARDGIMAVGEAGTEGARRATGVPACGIPEGMPDPMVSDRPTRRRFTAEYKLRIGCLQGRRCLGALLRRTGLYSSHLTAWRRQRDEIAKA